MMDRKETLIREVEDLPTAFLQEVLDFVQFLKAKETQDHLETALLSESALRKDWLKPEEDEAWQGL
jgi:hypothetical protein